MGAWGAAASRWPPQTHTQLLPPLKVALALAAPQVKLPTHRVREPVVVGRHDVAGADDLQQQHTYSSDTGARTFLAFRTHSLCTRTARCCVSDQQWEEAQAQSKRRTCTCSARRLLESPVTGLAAAGLPCSLRALDSLPLAVLGVACGVGCVCWLASEGATLAALSAVSLRGDCCRGQGWQEHGFAKPD